MGEMLAFGVRVFTKNTLLEIAAFHDVTSTPEDLVKPRWADVSDDDSTDVESNSRSDAISVGAAAGLERATERGLRLPATGPAEECFLRIRVCKSDLTRDRRASQGAAWQLRHGG